MPITLRLIAAIILLLSLPSTTSAEEEQYNKALPVLGGPENEARLKELIKKTIEPKPIARQPLPPSLKQHLQWSEPVNGLAARIERCGASTVLVRLKNSSDQPLIVPTGNPRDANVAQPFALYARYGVSPWRKAKTIVSSYCETSAPDEEETLAYLADGVQGIEADRPMVTLQPGEQCLAFVSTRYEEDTEFKVVLTRVNKVSQRHWTGVLETPPSPLRQMRPPPPSLLGRLAIPEHFPAINYNARMVSMGGSEPAVEGLWNRNWEIFDLLQIYDPAQVQREFELRLQAEDRIPVKLFLAVIAARAGSEKAALYLMEMAKHTDYLICINVHAALGLLFPYPDGQPPAWVVELSLAILADKRLLTNLEGTICEGGDYTFAFYEPGNILLWELANAKHEEVIPLLLERARAGHWDAIKALGGMGDERALTLLIELAQGGHVGAIEALGNLGDKRSIPILIELSTDPIRGPQALLALSKIDAKRAVPLLVQMLDHIKPIAMGSEHRYVIRKLAEIDAERAKPVLVKMLRKLPRSHVNLSYGRLSEPLATLAEVAGQLKAKEAVPTLLQYVEYPEIIKALADIGDPAAIPSLKKIIDEDAKIAEQHQQLPRDFAKKRVFTARMALCTWDADGGTARLLELLGDESLDEWKCAQAVRKLADCQDPKAIPALVGVIQVGEGHSSIDAALSGLAKLKYKAAVEGLIDCFDVDFKEESFNKGDYVTPAIYRNRIAQALQEITGQSFGSDKQQWLQWWQQQGQNDPNLN